MLAHVSRPFCHRQSVGAQEAFDQRAGRDLAPTSWTPCSCLACSEQRSLAMFVRGVTGSSRGCPRSRLLLGGPIAIRRSAIGKGDDAAAEGLRLDELEPPRSVDGVEETSSASEDEWVDHQGKLIEEVLCKEGLDKGDRSPT